MTLFYDKPLILKFKGFHFPTNCPDNKATLTLTWMFTTVQQQAMVSEDSLERLANTENKTKQKTKLSSH